MLLIGGCRVLSLGSLTPASTHTAHTFINNNNPHTHGHIPQHLTLETKEYNKFLSYSVMVYTYLWSRTYGSNVGENTGPFPVSLRFNARSSSSPVTGLRVGSHAATLVIQRALHSSAAGLQTPGRNSNIGSTGHPRVETPHRFHRSPPGRNCRMFNSINNKSSATCIFAPHSYSKYTVTTY